MYGKTMGGKAKENYKQGQEKGCACDCNDCSWQTQDAYAYPW